MLFWRCFILLVVLVAAVFVRAEPGAKPRVAVFPLAGDAPADLRERAGFSLRTKLDRTNTFDVIDGPKILDVLAETNTTVTLASTPDDLAPLAKLLDAQILLYGEIAANQLRVHLLDLRQPSPTPQTLTHPTTRPTDLRFAVEHALSAITDLPAFAAPVDTAVWHDETADQLWQSNPNLLANGDFSLPGHWSGVYRSELYPLPLRNDPPPVDKVAIVRNAGGSPTDAPGNHAVHLRLSVEAAESNGLAALSDPFPIQPNTRYRLQFRYKSDGPLLHIFVKGYTNFPAPTGEIRPRETYRRQLPLLEATRGQWVTITDDFNPQHLTLPIETLRVDLYTYRFPGHVLFDDVIVKAVGPQTRTATDAALKPTTTRPTHATP